MIGSVPSFPKSLKQIQKVKERSQRKSDHLIKKGLGSQFPNVVFVACKKHFEDDLKRKLSELGERQGQNGINGGHFWLRGDATKESVR